MPSGLFGYFCFRFHFFDFFRAAAEAHGSSQTRGQIGATAAGLHHSHSNVGSEPSLRPTAQLPATVDPQPTEQGQGLNPILVDMSWICLPCTTGTPVLFRYCWIVVTPVGCCTCFVNEMALRFFFCTLPFPDLVSRL